MSTGCSARRSACVCVFLDVRDTPGPGTNGFAVKNNRVSSEQISPMVGRWVSGRFIFLPSNKNSRKKFPQLSTYGLGKTILFSCLKLSVYAFAVFGVFRPEIFRTNPFEKRPRHDRSETREKTDSTRLLSAGKFCLYTFPF